MTRIVRLARTGVCAEVLGFAAAGLCAYLTDLALFVWLRGPVGLGPLPAKALSFVAACTVAYAGNALGPYRGRTGRAPAARVRTAVRQDTDPRGTAPGDTGARDTDLSDTDLSDTDLPDTDSRGTDPRSITCRSATSRPAGPGPSRLRRYGGFLAVNLAGAAVQLLCLGVTHYGLGFTSARADTVSGAGVGMALATVLRFWGTRTFVFRPAPQAGARTETA